MGRKKGSKAGTAIVVVAPKKRKQGKKKRGGVKGKGDYVLPAAYRAVGADLGGALGFPRVGRAAGAAVSMLRGHGDYFPIRGNSLIRGGVAMPVPKFVNNGRRGVDVVEREFLGLVRSTAAFTNSSYPINPGVSFPWLHTLALNFEEYRLNGCLFEFVSMSADWNGSSQAIGTVVMATDYDSSDSNYTSRVQMENSDYACSTRANESLIHPIECAPLERPTNVLFTRSGTIPLNADIKMYDVGNFQIATDGFQTDGVVIGELWVSYDVTFFKKQIAASANFSSLYNSVDLPTGSNPFGTFANRITWGQVDIQPSLKTLTLVGITNGTYVLRINYIGSSGNTAAGLPVLASMTNGTILADGDISASNTYYLSHTLVGWGITRASVGTNLGISGDFVMFVVTAPSPVLTFTTTSFNLTAGDARVQMDLYKFGNGAPLPLLASP